MMKAFNTLVKPANDTLADMLGVTPNYDEDYTVIPVRVKFPSGTTQVIEDGYVTDCDHHGADMGDVDIARLHVDSSTGDVSEIDNNYRALVCDKCPAWKIPAGGEWYE